MEVRTYEKQLREWADELFRLANKVIAEADGVRIRMSIGNGDTYVRVLIAEDGQEFSDDGNTYSLYINPEKWSRTSRNYQLCRMRIIRILAENATKKP